jgi:hypothetical protein
MNGSALLSRYGPALYILAFVLAVMLISTWRERMLVRNSKTFSPMPVGRILQKAIGDTPAFLAATLTAAIVILAVTSTEIPKPLSDAFFIAVGYYFGERTHGPQRPAAGDAASSRMTRAEIEEEK